MLIPAKVHSDALEVPVRAVERIRRADAATTLLPIPLLEQAQCGGEDAAAVPGVGPPAGRFLTGARSLSALGPAA